MQKIAATYLAFLILFQGIFINTDIIFEMNELAQDYQLHKVKYGDDLTTFISKHFGDLKETHKEQHQQEHKEHKHPANEISSSLQIEYAFCSTNTFHQVSIEIHSSSSDFYYKDLFSNFEKQKIFQPPRLT